MSENHWPDRLHLEEHPLGGESGHAEDVAECPEQSRRTLPYGITSGKVQHVVAPVTTAPESEGRETEAEGRVTAEGRRR